MKLLRFIKRVSKIDKLKSCYKKHYYAISVFLFIIVYSCLVPGGLRAWTADGVNLSFHTVDYSMGFCSRVLPGAIYNLFFDSVSPEKTGLYLSVLLIVFFAVLSVFLEKFLLSIQQNYLKTTTIILMFFLTGPATFSIYVERLGTLDVYWIFSMALFFILLSNKKTYMFLFVPFILCILTCYTSIIAFIPFFTIIIIYKISAADSKSEKYILSFSLAISLLLSVGLTMYFMIYEKQNLVYSMEEFNNIITSRGAPNIVYYDETWYGYCADEQISEIVSEVTAMGFDTSSFFGELVIRIKLNMEYLNLSNKLPFSVTIIPVFYFLYNFFIYKIKKCKNFFRKITYILILLLPIGTITVALLTTTDFIRWVAHSFLPLFVSFLYVLHKEGEDNWKYVKEKIGLYSFKTIIIYLVYYASVIYDPYYI